ncbi:MAG: hypothetical protein ACK56F_14025 [bacterium]
MVRDRGEGRKRSGLQHQRSEWPARKVVAVAGLHRITSTKLAGHREQLQQSPRDGRLTGLGFIRHPTTSLNPNPMCLPIAIKRPDYVLATGEHLGYEWNIVHNGIGYRCGYVRFPNR